VQVREGPLDDPALAAEPGAALGPAPSDHGLDAALPEFAAVFVVVIAAVSEQRFGALAGPADLLANLPDNVDQRQQPRDVVAVAAGQANRQRDPGAVGQQMVLGARAGTVNRYP
jgi:hypothetical protein